MEVKLPPRDMGKIWSLPDELVANGIIGDLMNDSLFSKGLAQRKATLGEEYVESSLAQADEFTRPFQEAMTSWCWGFGWADTAIDAKTRSMMNLSMLGALGNMHEWNLHCRGAITNGVSIEEIRAIIHAVGIYAGVPRAVACFREAREILGDKIGIDEQGIMVSTVAKTGSATS